MLLASDVNTSICISRFHLLTFASARPVWIWSKPSAGMKCQKQFQKRRHAILSVVQTPMFCVQCVGLFAVFQRQNDLTCESREASSAEKALIEKKKSWRDTEGWSECGWRKKNSRKSAWLKMKDVSQCVSAFQIRCSRVSQCVRVGYHTSVDRPLHPPNKT